MSRKYFGTDGIRGRVGDDPITPQFFLHLGWAIGKALTGNKHNNGLVLIGKDTRISGYMFESALEAGLICAGVNVGLLGPMPTPAIAYLTRTFQAQGGIVISASHNPYEDNGIKLFNSEGTKLDDAMELRIESLLAESMSTNGQLGKAHRIVDAEGRYIEFCKGSLPWGFSLEGMNIVVDCANGATYNIAPKVFRELGANVSVIGSSPDGLNINLRCGSTQLNAIKKEVLEKHADLGIAFDGDGDRVLFVDQTGETVDGDQLLYIIARSKHLHNGGCSGVVGTLMTNLGFELGLKELGVPFERAKVGDRYVIEAMKRRSWRLGGESSGHIVCDDITTTGDGVISALQVLKALKFEGKALHEAKQSMQKLPQVMINVKASKKIDLDGNDTIQEAIGYAIDQMNGEGRVLLRPSGTEPVVRVMVEGRQHDLVSRCAEELSVIVEKVLAS